MPLPSQKRVAQSASDNAHARAHSLSRTGLLKARVHLYKVESHKTASLVHALGDEVALAQSQTASHGSAGAGSETRVKSIDVEGQMDRSVRANPAQSHVHDLADAVTVDVVHAERLDAVLAQDLLLAAIHVAQADVYQLLDADAVLVLQPAERRVGLVRCETRQERDWHAVDVAAVGRLGRVDVGVRVHPDHGHVAAQALADRFGSAADGADGDAVVAAESEDAAAFFGVVVDLLAERFRHGADGTRLLHAAVVGVGRGQKVGVRVDFVVKVDVVLEIVLQLVREARLDQSHWRSIDARFALGDMLDCESRLVSCRVVTCLTA